MKWTDEYEAASDLRERIRGGRGVVGALIELSDPSVAEIFATVGLDFVIIDEEHAAHSRETVQLMLQACTGSRTRPFVRPVKADHDVIRRFLDLGAMGIVAPLIESPQEAAALVASCRYPPVGDRSFGPIRASGYFSQKDLYMEVADTSIVVMPMIESRAGVEAVEEIAAVPGVDAICIGPSDLSMSLGCRGRLSEPVYLNAVERVVKACAENSIGVGAGAYDPEQARALLGASMNFAVAAADVGLLMSGADAALAIARGAG